MKLRYTIPKTGDTQIYVEVNVCTALERSVLTNRLTNFRRRRPGVVTLYCHIARYKVSIMAVKRCCAEVTTVERDRQNPVAGPTIREFPTRLIRYKLTIYA